VAIDREGRSKTYQFLIALQMIDCAVCVSVGKCAQHDQSITTAAGNGNCIYRKYSSYKIALLVSMPWKE